MMATGGLTGQNILYYHKAGGFGEGDLQVLAEQVTLAWETNVAPTVTSDWALVEVVATSLDSLDGVKQIWRPAIPIQGGRVENSSPANVSMAVKFGVPRRGRGINGRVFVFGIPETEVGAGFITSTYASAVAAGWRTMQDDVASGALADHVVVHRTVGGVRPPEGDAETVTSYSYTDLAVDSQKLRLPNHRKAKRRAAA